MSEEDDEAYGFGLSLTMVEIPKSKRAVKQIYSIHSALDCLKHLKDEELCIRMIHSDQKKEAQEAVAEIKVNLRIKLKKFFKKDIRTYDEIALGVLSKRFVKAQERVEGDVVFGKLVDELAARVEKKIQNLKSGSRFSIKRLLSPLFK
jgi:hypothetical protein